MPSFIIYNWAYYVSQCTKMSRNNPYKFFKVKNIKKYTLFKEISVHIIFYYNKPHISLTYNLILISFNILYSKIVQWSPALSSKFYVLWMSKEAGKRRLNWCDSKLIWFENWYHKKMKQKNEKLTSNLI